MIVYTVQFTANGDKRPYEKTLLEHKTSTLNISLDIEHLRIKWTFRYLALYIHAKLDIFCEVSRI